MQVLLAIGFTLLDSSSSKTIIHPESSRHETDPYAAKLEILVRELVGSSSNGSGRVISKSVEEKRERNPIRRETDSHSLECYPNIGIAQVF